MLDDTNERFILTAMDLLGSDSEEALVRDFV
jgi:hypothetical protein